jgi:hypothetical protein
MLNANKHINGSGTLTFNNAAVLFATRIGIMFAPKHTTAPDVLQGSGPLGHSFDGCDITVTATVNRMDLDTIAMASGYNGNIGPGQTLMLDESIRRPLRGPLTVLATQLDGTSVKLYLKAAECVPEDNTVELAKGEFAGVTLRFVKCDPGDGTKVVGSIEWGQPV